MIVEKMTCSGCSGAVTRVLEKARADGMSFFPPRGPIANDYISGVSSYTVDLATQEVVVQGTIPYDDVLAKIKKTGKEVRG